MLTREREGERERETGVSERGLMEATSRTASTVAIQADRTLWNANTVFGAICTPQGGHHRGVGGIIITLYRALSITLINKYAFPYIT